MGSQDSMNMERVLVTAYSDRTELHGDQRRVFAELGSVSRRFVHRYRVVLDLTRS